jgi:type I restriction enzyme S subunit
MNKDVMGVQEVSPGYEFVAEHPAVPVGYKQTEVGVIPEGWEVKTLGSALRKGRLGGNYPNQSTASDYPLMKMGNLGRGYFDVSKQEYISGGIIPDEQHKLRYGDVVFNTRNTLDLVGKIAIWRDELPRAYYNSNLMRLEFDEDIVASNEYANYALNTTGSITRLRALATGTTSVAAIYTRDLLDFSFIVPPKSEQKAIATALSDVDALLEELDRLIAKKRDIKQAAMQQLLTGETRLPGFEGEWEAIPLGSLGRFLKGSGIKRDDALSGDIPCVRYGEIYTLHNDIIREFHSWISDEVAQSAVPIQKGDVLFAGSGETKEEIGKSVALIDEVAAYAGGDIVILRTNNADPTFLGYALNQPSVIRQKSRFGQGDAVVHISAASLAKVVVKVPRVEEQEAIATVLSDMDTEIQALEQRRNKTAELKQGMMQELLTGRTRLV